MKNKRRGWDIGGSGHNWPPGAGDSGAWPSVSPLSSPRPWPETAPPWATYPRLSKSSCSCLRLVAAKVLGASGKLKAYSFATKKFYFCRCADPVGRKVAPGQRGRKAGHAALSSPRCHTYWTASTYRFLTVDLNALPCLSRAEQSTLLFTASGSTDSEPKSYHEVNRQWTSKKIAKGTTDLRLQ